MVPQKATIGSIIENLVLADEKNSKLEAFHGLSTKIDKYLTEKMKISELVFLYESTGSQGILDLFIEDPRINFAVIPLD